jgi:hypothetical protein
MAQRSALNTSNLCWCFLRPALDAIHQAKCVEFSLGLTIPFASVNITVLEFLHWDEKKEFVKLVKINLW